MFCPNHSSFPTRYWPVYLLPLIVPLLIALSVQALEIQQAGRDERTIFLKDGFVDKPFNPFFQLEDVDDINKTIQSRQLDVVDGKDILEDWRVASTKVENSKLVLYSVVLTFSKLPGVISFNFSIVNGNTRLVFSATYTVVGVVFYQTSEKDANVYFTGTPGQPILLKDIPDENSFGADVEVNIFVATRRQTAEIPKNSDIQLIPNDTQLLPWKIPDCRIAVPEPSLLDKTNHCTMAFSSNYSQFHIRTPKLTIPQMKVVISWKGMYDYYKIIFASDENSQLQSDGSNPLTNDEITFFIVTTETDDGPLQTWQLVLIIITAVLLLLSGISLICYCLCAAGSCRRPNPKPELRRLRDRFMAHEKHFPHDLEDDSRLGSVVEPPSEEDSVEMLMLENRLSRPISPADVDGVAPDGQGSVQKFVMPKGVPRGVELPLSGTGSSYLHGRDAISSGANVTSVPRDQASNAPGTIPIDISSGPHSTNGKSRILHSPSQLGVSGKTSEVSPVVGQSHSPLQNSSPPQDGPSQTTILNTNSPPEVSEISQQTGTATKGSDGRATAGGSGPTDGSAGNTTSASDGQGKKTDSERARDRVYEVYKQEKKALDAQRNQADNSSPPLDGVQASGVPDRPSKRPTAVGAAIGRIRQVDMLFGPASRGIVGRNGVPIPGSSSDRGQGAQQETQQGSPRDSRPVSSDSSKPK